MKTYILSVYELDGHDEPTHPEPDDIKEALDNWGNASCEVTSLDKGTLKGLLVACGMGEEEAIEYASRLAKRVTGN